MEAVLIASILYGVQFGSQNYSKGKLVAEMGAVYLCAQAEIVNKTIDNGAAYIKGWMARIEDDKNWLIHAATQEQKSTNYFLGVDHL